MQGKITKRSVDALEAGQILYDEEVKGFVARCLSSGTVSYGYRFRNEKGQSRWEALGIHGSITADQARTLAKKRAGAVADGRDPVAEKEETRAQAAREKLADINTVSTVLDKFVARYARKQENLRSADQIQAIFDRLVKPAIGEKSIYGIRRSDIREMLDKIADANGPVMADRVLAHVRTAFNWQMEGDDDFTNPIGKGVIKPRADAAKRARKRMLADDEIRSVWQALDSTEVPEAFRNIVRELLLTVQRRNEVANMHSDEIDAATWIIPAERYKTGSPNVVPLTETAQQWIKGKGYIFSTTGGKRPFSGFSKAKTELDRIIAKQRKAAGLKPLPNWTLHDLRRTGRSLMARAGVPSDVAEQVLGHKIAGVEGVYNRHDYIKEKREALEKLAGLVALILNPPAGNVVKLERAAQ
jgi:integrase